MASVLSDRSVPLLLPEALAEVADAKAGDATPPSMAVTLAADRQVREALDEMQAAVGAIDWFSGAIGLMLLALVLTGWLLA